MLVKSATHKTDDKTKILKAVGRLADGTISDDSRSRIIDDLTKLLGGKPIAKETFDAYGIEAELIREDGKPEVLEITVPYEYLPISMVSTKEAAKVTFTMSKVLDMDFRGR